MSARRRRTPFPLAAILIVLAVGPLAACGSDSDDAKLLTRASATQLRDTLLTLEEQVDIGNCSAAQGQVTVLASQVSQLDGVDPDLKDSLESGVSRLQQLVLDECQAPAAETGPTGPAETGGATGPAEQQTDEKGKKDKDKDKKKDQSGDEDGSGGQQDEGTGDESGGSGDTGTTGSGGFAP